MKNARFAHLIIQPSLGGLLGIFGLSLAVMIIAGLAFANSSGIIYDYLLGPNSSAALIESSRSTLEAIDTLIFGNAILNKILFFIFWMLVGLVVYVILSGVGSGIDEAGQAAEESTFINSKKNKILEFLELKIALRIIAFQLLIIFTYVFIKFLMPVGVLTARIVAGNAGQLNNWIYALIGMAVLSGSFYILMVLVRFLLLRPRILANLDDLIIDEIEHSDHNTNN